MTEMTAPSSALPKPLASHGASPLTGRFATPGDKAMSHRALLIGALAVGHTAVEGILDARDVEATADALRQLGVRIDARDGAWHVHGLGIKGLLAPQVRLDLKNSGTGLRLLLGLLAPYGFAARFTGDATLTRRPLRALLEALAPIGVAVEETVEHGLPLTRRGPDLALPFHHVMAAPSDQIKSALLLAAVQIPGVSTIVEPIATSDHTERLLAAFGADIIVVPDETGGGATITVTGLAPLQPRHVMVPGDPSSAGYAIVAALIVPGSDLVVDNVLVNPARTGLIDTLLQMGGDIQFINQREVGGEHVADLRVRSSRLKGIRVDADQAAAMLDDIPILAVAAAYAQGETTIEGLAELRLQECDRLAATTAGLAANKVAVREGETSLTIGGEGKVAGGGTVQSRADHRIVMAFLVLGLASRNRVTLDDTAAIAASFPGFVAAMTAAGGRFETVKGR